MDLDQTQAIPIEYDDEDDETDDETNEKKPVAFIKFPCQKGIPEKLYPLFEGDNTIGRQESCNVCIPVKALSKQHACVEIRGESHLIYDKESRNKTRRGKLFLSPNVRYELKHDDRLIFADVHCIYQYGKEIHKRDISGSETGSESILLVPVTKASTNGGSCHTDPASESILLEEEDEGSDDSVDLLQPTQAFSTDVPTFGKKKEMATPFLFPDEAEEEDGTTNNRNISVKDTPFIDKKNKFASAVVLPESESEADNSIIAQGPPPTLIFEEEKDTSADADLLGAPTQAFLAESDLEESDADEDDTKTNTLLNAETQMCPDVPSDSDDDATKRNKLLNAATQICPDVPSDSDDDATKRNTLLNAATQICPDVPSDSDDDATKRNTLLNAETQMCPDLPSDTDNEDDKAALDAPTQAFVEASDSDSPLKTKTKKKGMTSDVYSPVQPCSMEAGDSEKTKEMKDTERDESEKDKGQVDPLVMETQVFEEDEADSDEEKDMSHLFTASTLACEMPSDEENEVTEDDATQAFGDNTSMVLALSLSVTDKHDDSTQVIGDEDATVLVENRTLDTKQGVSALNKSDVDEDATLVINDAAEHSEEKCKGQKSKTIVSVPSDENATQVCDDATLAVDEPLKKAKDDKSKHTDEKTKHTDKVPPDDDATQVLDMSDDATQPIEIADDATLVIGETEKKPEDKKSEDMNEVSPDDDATQVLEMVDDATLVMGKTEKKPEGKKSKDMNEVPPDDDATQVLEMVEEPERKSIDNAPDDDATQVYQTADDAILAIEEPQKKTRGRKPKTKTLAVKNTDKKSDQDIPPGDDATLVLQTEDVAVLPPGPEKKTRGRKPKATTQSLAVKDTGQKSVDIPPDDDTTQVSGTGQKSVDIPPDDDTTQVATLATDATLAIDEIENKSENHDEDATPVYQTDNDVTFVIEESVESREDQSKSDIPADDDATDNATLPVEDEPDKPKEIVKKTRGRSKKNLNTDKQKTNQNESNTNLNKTIDLETVPSATDISQKQTKKTSGRKRLRNTRTTKTNEKEMEEHEIKESAERGKQSKARKSDAASSKTKLSSVEQPTRTVDDSEGSTLPLDSEDLNSETPECSANEVTSVPCQDEDNLEATQAYSDTVEVLGKPGFKSRQTRRQTTGSVLVASSTKARSRRSVPVKATVTKKTEKQEKKVDVSDLEATQVYGMEDEDTISDVDAKTPEKIPLKSALASPNKKRSPSPSPKRVGFKMQKSLEKEKEKTVKSPRGRKRKMIAGDKEEESKDSNEEMDLDKMAARTSKRGKNQTAESEEKSVVENATIPNISLIPNISVIKRRLEDLQESDDDLNKSGFSKRKRNPVMAATIRYSKSTGSKDSIKSKDLGVSSDSVMTDASVEVKERSRRGGNKTQTIDKTGVVMVDSQNEKGSKKLKGTDDQISEVPSKRVSRRSTVSGVRSDNKTKADKEECQDKKSSGRLKAVDDEVTQVSSSKRVSRRSVLSSKKPIQNELEKESTKARSVATKNETSKADKTGNKNEQTVDKKLSKRQKNAAEKNKAKNTDAESKDTHSEKNTSQSDDPQHKVDSKSTRNHRGRKSVQPETVEQPLKESNTSRKRRATLDVVNEAVKLKQAKIYDFTSSGSGDSASPVSKAKGKKKPVEAKAEEKGKQLPAEDKSKGKGKQSAEVIQEVQTRRTSRTSLAPHTVTGDSKSKGGRKSRSVSKVAAETREELQTSENTVGKRRGGQTNSQTNEASRSPAKKTKAAEPTSPSRRKSPKSASAHIGSPSLRRTSLAPKPRVMFTGVVDEQGEKTVKDLGGELGTSLEGCTHLVTDKVRRTVKFLGCLARGLPIVNPQWLHSCKAAGTFIDCSKFLVSDAATEKLYKFSLVSSIEHASNKQMLTDYKIHVTKSVRPDPSQMKDILHCAGAQYVTGMPRKQEEKLIVISCEEDKTACQPALNAGIPVVNAEFILTGILKQELNVNNYRLFADGKTGTAGTRSKGRKR